MILNTRTLGSSRFRQPWLSDVKIKGGKILGTHTRCEARNSTANAPVE